MRWEDGRQSDNVEDRRGSSVSRGVVGGGIGTVILVLVAMYFGVDPSVILNMASTGTNRPAVKNSAARPAEENAHHFRAQIRRHPH